MRVQYVSPHQPQNRDASSGLSQYNRQRDDTVTLVLAKLADPLMPRTRPNANLHPGLFLSPTDLDLNGYHGGMPAERGVERLVDRAKVVGLTPQPF